MSAVADGLAKVEARVVAACTRAGRPRDGVLLLAVSKLQPVAAVEEAYGLGLRDFGENYPQELRDKAAALAHLQGLRWHAIGRLQKNKAKYVAKAASAFHALDDLAVAQELGRRRDGDAPLPCYVEVDLAGEAQKGGVAEAALPSFLERARSVPGISIQGLMSLPPLSEHPEATRPYFVRLRHLAEREGLKELSMGTTADFEIAIEEGATCVRVGTALFGARKT